MTRGEIRSAVAEALRQTNLVRWTSAEVDQYIDDGYTEIANDTGCLVKTVQWQVYEEQHIVRLPDDCLKPLAFRDMATGLPIDMSSWMFIDRQDGFWRRKTSTRPWLVAPWGLKDMLLYPAYSTPQNGIEIMYSFSPTTGLASDSSVPDFPDEFHVALVDYAHHRCLLKDADGPRLGRSLRQLGYNGEKIEQLRAWSDNRHANITKQCYGEHFRTAQYSGWA